MSGCHDTKKYKTDSKFLNRSRSCHPIKNTEIVILQLENKLIKKKELGDICPLTLTYTIFGISSYL